MDGYVLLRIGWSSGAANRTRRVGRHTFRDVVEQPPSIIAGPVLLRRTKVLGKTGIKLRRREMILLVRPTIQMPHYPR